MKPVKHIIKDRSGSNRRGEQMAAGNESLRETQLRNRLRDLQGHISLWEDKRCPASEQWKKSIARCPLLSGSKAVGKEKKEKKKKEN